MRTARKNKKSAMTEDILRNLLRCFFKYNFKLLTAKNLFYTPQKTSLDARTSSRSNYISKNIFAKYNAIRLILFICTCVFKFNKSFYFFLSFRKINVKKRVEKTRAFNRRT